MLRGKLISIEGVEGAGKSTVMDFVKSYLQSKNIAAAFTREPGGTVLAEKFRDLLLHPETDEMIEPKTELLLMFAGREQHLCQRIIPWLREGKWVVSDRYIDATYAYQGGGRGMDIELITLLDHHIVGNVYPDLTLLLDLSPEVGFERTMKREHGKDRIESERMDFFQRVRAVYLQRAKQDTNRMKMVNAELTLSEVQQQVKSYLDEFIVSVTP